MPFPQVFQNRANHVCRDRSHRHMGKRQSMFQQAAEVLSLALTAPRRPVYLDPPLSSLGKSCLLGIRHASCLDWIDILHHLSPHSGCRVYGVTQRHT